MNVDFTEAQLMLKESLSRRFTATAGLRSLDVAERWQEYAEAGLLGMAFPENFGGLGLGATEVMIFQEAVGRAQVRDAFLSTVVFGGECLRQYPDHAFAAAVMRDIVAGTCKVAFAHWEAASRSDHDSVDTKATADGGKWILNGTKALVSDASEADLLIVSARIGDSSDVSLFFVDPRSEGVSTDPMRRWDGHSIATVNLSAVEVSTEKVLNGTDTALPTISRAIDAATAAICAEAVGAMSGAFELTLSHLKTRRQFKVPLATFQALRHKVADMFMALELARSATMAAATACQYEDAVTRRRSVSRAKVQINRSGRMIGQAAIQLHGAIGLTDEYPLGGYFRRLTVISQLFGDEHYHLRQLATEQECTLP